MPTDLGPLYPATFRGKPPHISPEDYLIFDRWWPTWSKGVTATYFDVGLGKGVPIPPGTPPNYAKMRTRLSQARADIVAIKSNQLWIIELRFQANTNAVGRVLGYKTLYLEDPILGKDVHLLIVSNLADAIMPAVTKSVGISYEVA